MPDLDPQTRDLVARTVLSEAQNDGERGMAAVANVIKNRTDSGRYGDSPVDVVLQRNAFEPWSLKRNDPNHPSRWSTKNPDYQKASAIVDSVWRGDVPDETQGATHFYSKTDQAALGRRDPDWAQGKPLAHIGHHSFYAPEGAVTPDLLGSWNGGSANGAPAAAAAPQDDLLGSWASAVVPSSKIASAPLPAPPQRSQHGDMPIMLPGETAAAKPSTPHEETMPEAINRLMAAAHGHGERNLSDLITGARPDSWGDTAAQTGLGILRGMGDVGDTLGQGIAYAGEKGAGALQRVGVISPQTGADVAAWRARVNADIARNNAAFTTNSGDGLAPDVGRIGGQIAATAPLLGAAGTGLTTAARSAPIISGAARWLAGRPLLSSVVGGGGTGVGGTLLTSSVSDQPLSDQLKQGGTVGAVVGPVGRVAGVIGRKIAGAAIDPETANLAHAATNKYGIDLRADQVSGNPMVRFMGSVMQRLPFTGLGEHVGEQQAAFNRSIANEFGENSDKITQPVLKSAARRIGDVFDDVANRTGNIQVDRPFVNDVTRVMTDARSVLGRDAEPIENQVHRIVDRIDSKTGSISPESYQSLTRKDTPLSRAQQSKDPNVRHYANQLRNALDDMMQRSAPADAVADLKQARYQWAVMKAIEPLAKKAPTGDISPALLLAKSKGGNIEELGQIGQRFLKEPPSSGTAERLAVIKAGAAIAGGLGGAAYFDPENFQRDAALLGGGLLAARGGGAALKSRALTGALVRNGRQNFNPRRMNVLSGDLLPAAGALIARTNSKSLASAP